MGRKLTAEEEVALKKRILEKLYAAKAYTKGHLLFERLMRSVEAHLRGFVNDALKDLARDGLVACYGKTMHGEAYQLNIKRLGEIRKFIKIANKG